MNLKSKDYLIFTSLFIYAIFIWLRDLSWLVTSDDTLPVLVGIPLFIWFGSPWKMREDPQPISTNLIVTAVLLLLAGIILNLTLLLALSWVMILWAWIKSSVEPESFPKIKKLLILPLIAFPWITLDLQPVGWWFRLSGAWTAAHAFSLAGYDVTQDGTNLLINGLPISVEAACAGLNTLQSMLIAGSIANFLILGETNRYWYNIPLLFVLSWVANTIRIIGISIVAITVSPEFAMGDFHTWGGWGILVFMFILCWGILSLQEPKVEGQTN